MDKLTIFGMPDISGDITVIREDKTNLDDVTDGLGKVATGNKKILEQLQVTHLGHERELWGKDFSVEEEMAGEEEEEE